MAIIKDIFKDCFTDSSGEHWEWASIQGGLSFIAFHIFCAYHYIILKNPFDPVAYGSGNAAIAAATGAHKLMSAKGDAS